MLSHGNVMDPKFLVASEYIICLSAERKFNLKITHATNKLSADHSTDGLVIY